MRLTYLCFFWFMYFVFSLSLPDHFAVAHVTPSVQPLCHDDERIALLQFKDSLIINKFASRDPSPYPKVASWNLEKENSNCCLWDGIKCSEETGHVIRLDLSNSCLSGSINSTSSLFHLVHLRWLSLADNDFNQSQIPSTIINLSRLSRLNLSMSGFSGQVPAELLELSKLVSLDLSYNDYLEIQRPGLGSLFDKLSNLKVLNLSYVNISSSIPHNLGNLSSLTYLSLASCQMQGPITPSICKLSKLVFLDIENNDFSEELPTFIGCLGSLEILDVSECNFSGRVPSSFSNLTQLSYLDLSDNNFLGQDSSSLSWIAKNSKLNKLGLVNMNLIGEIPSWLVNLTQLTKLYMGYNQLTGQIPSEMFELSKLVYLDISSNDGLELRGAGLRSLFEKLSNLEVLKLAYVNISSSIPHNLENLSSLTDFSLENCGMQGTIPSSICNLTKLAYLDLAYNNFSGELPTFIGCLGSLKELYIPNSNFSSRLPSSLSNLTQLNYLSLSSMNLTGEIPSWLMNLTQLTHLSLSFNQLTGQIPSWISNMNQLSLLNFFSNQLTGQIPSEISNLTRLRALALARNNFQGPIPSSFFELKNLEHIILSSNNLSGTLELDLFLRKFKHLRELDLSSNNLSLLTKNIASSIVQKFWFLGLGSCNLREFPNFLQNQDQLGTLDLSSNQIAGQIPEWLSNTATGELVCLNLSNNFLIGFDQPSPIILPWFNLISLDLRSNKLQGPLPVPPVSTLYYLVSNNNLSREVPQWICNFPLLRVLDLSGNELSGVLPQCSSNLSTLSVLDLQSNKIHGNIPENFMNGTNMRMMDLSNNSLQGRIPRSLAAYRMLEFLNLGDNQINDNFPAWLGTLPKLQVLILQSNKLHGVMKEPVSDFEFPKLRIMDLSFNSFTGKLPSKYFQCWNAMKFVGVNQLTYMVYIVVQTTYPLFSSPDTVYGYSLTLNNKGVKLKYGKISNMFIGILLSNNKFTGEIPASIANLKGLQTLNLSYNDLQGHIPPSMGNLTALESLDLSYNKLSGEIPQQLAELTFLEVFNVSHNHLIGPVPWGKQFDTFDNTSFDGNPGLCGKLLSIKCGNYSEVPHKEDEDSESQFTIGWKIVLIGYVSGLIVGVVLGQEFYTRKHESFSKILGGKLKKNKRQRGRRN